MTTSNFALNTYLFFDGRCEEAIEFYQKILGAEVQMIVRFKDAPDPKMRPPGAEEKIMHARVAVGGAILMVSDGRCPGEAPFSSFSLSLTTYSEADAEHYFAALSEGGEPLMPLEKTFFSPRFGMVNDKFGVGWMIMAEPPSGS